ncbi:MAG: stress response protein SCP2 [Psychromonas sp.]
MVRYDLSEDYSTESALIFGELYRDKESGNLRQLVKVTQVGCMQWQSTMELILHNIFLFYVKRTEYN